MFQWSSHLHAESNTCQSESNIGSSIEAKARKETTSSGVLLEVAVWLDVEVDEARLDAELIEDA